MYNKEDFNRLIEMGFSKDAIEKAYRVAAERKISVLDVLTNSQSLKNNYTAPPINSNGTHNKNNSQQTNKQQPVAPFVHRSFLISKPHTMLDGYECVYDINNPQIGQSTLENSSEPILIQRRQAGIPVALLNVSNCCYLNSLVQGYFLMPKVFRCLLQAIPLNKEQLNKLVPNSIRNKRITNSHKLLRAIQGLFSQMALSNCKELDPSEVLSSLVDSVGNRVSYGQEKDLSEINEEFISRLQECTAYTKNNPGLTEEDKPPTSPLDPLLFGQKIEITNDSEEQQVKSKFFGMILGYKHGSVSRALQEQFHYTVESGDKKFKKDLWITKLPEYLFFYIQRTAYDKNKGVVKIKEKIDFNFEIYMDRYLYSNRHNKNNPLIQQQEAKKEVLRQQLLVGRALMKSLDNCSNLIQRLESNPPPVELPEHTKPMTDYLKTIENSIRECDECISKLETRQQKYRLTYIIVHRGRADSGHYWGYGLSGGRWWRLDIKCGAVDKEVMMKQIEHGDAVVYALIYSKGEEPDSSPNYDLFLQPSQEENAKSYWNIVPQEAKSKILRMNIVREKDHQMKKLNDNVALVTLEYEERLKNIEEAVAIYKSKGDKYPMTQNLSLFIRWSSPEITQSLKMHLLDLTFRHYFKKGVAAVLLNASTQAESIRGQLLDSFKENLNKGQAPDKLTMSKIEYEKLMEKFDEYKRERNCELYILKALECIRQNKWEQAAQLTYKAVLKNCKSYLKKISQQLLDVVVVRLLLQQNQPQDPHLREYLEVIKYNSSNLYQNCYQLGLISTSFKAPASKPIDATENLQTIDENSDCYNWALKQSNQIKEYEEHRINKQLQQTYPGMKEWVKKMKSILQKSISSKEQLLSLK